MIEPVRLYRDHPQDRVAVVSVTSAYDREGEWLLRVARGASTAALQSAGVYGPYGGAELRARFDGVVDGLRAEGFEASGLVLTLAELQDPSRKRRALAARRLGWRLRGASSKDAAAAVDGLLAAAEVATEELCTILDALGRIGDPRAIPLLRKYAERKLLSRRRSGVEALRGLGDAEGLTAARQRAIEGLEPSLREALLKVDENAAGGDAVKTLSKAVVALPGRRRGRAADTLYELGTPATIAAARRVLARLPVERANVWRYLKSVLKRAMLRHDPATLGFLALRVERAAASLTGSRATVKSGRDGKMRDTVIFGRKTQRYMLRRVWRHLSFVARHRPERYPETAAEILARYRHQDAAKPEGVFGAFAHCYLLHRILWGQSPRYRLLDGSLRWCRVDGVAEASDGVREESHPELWDAQPRAYLRLLAKARLVEVQKFAVRAVNERHSELLENARLDELQAMLKAPYPATVELALVELKRRFDPGAPDWTLVLTVAEDDRDQVRAVAHDWLRATAHLWTRHAGPTMSWLDARHADVRFLAADLAAAAMADATPELRTELSGLLLERLQPPEAEEGQHDAYATVAAALAAEIDGKLSLDEVMALIEDGSSGAKTVAGAVLGRRPEAFDELGERRVLNLAEDELVAVRGAAQALFGAVRERFRDDPSLLFVLVESEWQDNRVFALGVLGELDLSRLGLNGLLALCDSNRVDVQDMGKDLVRRSFEELDAELVTQRLAEHPHRNVRRFVVELLTGSRATGSRATGSRATSHLEPGADALKRLDGFFRAVLFDLAPERRLKRAVVDFLMKRGEGDVAEAEVAARILDDAVRSSTRADFEHALVALTRLRLAQPATASLVTLEPARLETSS